MPKLVPLKDISPSITQDPDGCFILTRHRMSTPEASRRVSQIEASLLLSRLQSIRFKLDQDVRPIATENGSLAGATADRPTCVDLRSLETATFNYIQEHDDLMGGEVIANWTWSAADIANITGRLVLAPASDEAHQHNLLPPSFGEFDRIEPWLIGVESIELILRIGPYPDIHSLLDAKRRLATGRKD